LNGLQADWPLQIGQKLVISPGNVTPSPTLSNIQKLTPEADGKYYHTVQSGETLSWIASLYDISLSDLMTWNGLNAASVIRPEQKLLLMVAPPATETPTPTPTVILPTASPSMTQALPTATPTVAASKSSRGLGVGLVLGVIAVVVGGALWWIFSRRG
jgi:LysM repeat protein